MGEGTSEQMVMYNKKLFICTLFCELLQVSLVDFADMMSQMMHIEQGCAFYHVTLCWCDI